VLSGRLRTWRSDAGITLREFAKGVGLSISAVSAWETGTRFPSGEHLGRLSTYTRIPMCALLYPGKGDCPVCGDGKLKFRPCEN